MECCRNVPMEVMAALAHTHTHLSGQIAHTQRVVGETNRTEQKIQSFSPRSFFFEFKNIIDTV
jgi:hypothetical protein